jgi:hypothetical protein
MFNRAAAPDDEVDQKSKGKDYYDGSDKEIF